MRERERERERENVVVVPQGRRDSECRSKKIISLWL
jgi:hypothetical protein